MHGGFRDFDPGLLPVAAGTLTAGLLLFGFGQTLVARLTLASGAAVVAAALTIAIVQALRRKQAGVDVLALLAIGLALGLGEFLAAAVLALMIESGKAIENYAQARSQREMSALLSRAPESANRFDGGEWHTVGLDTIHPGDRLLVRHGEVVPVDGALLGAATVDESALTGESVPRQRSTGETVRSSVLNAGAPFEMVAAATRRTVPSPVSRGWCVPPARNARLPRGWPTATPSGLFPPRCLLPGGPGLSAVISPGRWRCWSSPAPAR